MSNIEEKYIDVYIPIVIIIYLYIYIIATTIIKYNFLKKFN